MASYDYVRIVFFEVIATAFFAYGICCSQNLPPPYPTPSGYNYVSNPGHSAFVSMSLFLAICWCGQLTGGHCNPAVTTVFIMKKDSAITLKVGLIYMGSQVAGAFLGCFFGKFILTQPGSLLTT
jgi:glycerol uptake facilitator-like aquaporin